MTCAHLPNVCWDWAAWTEPNTEIQLDNYDQTSCKCKRCDVMTQPTKRDWNQIVNFQSLSLTWTCGQEWKQRHRFSTLEVVVVTALQDQENLYVSLESADTSNILLLLLFLLFSLTPVILQSCTSTFIVSFQNKSMVVVKIENNLHVR